MYDSTQPNKGIRAILVGGILILVVGLGLIIYGVITRTFFEDNTATLPQLTNQPGALLMMATPMTQQHETPIPTLFPTPTPTPTPPPIIVFITGAVEKPDVYVVPANARVKDVVMAAGGLTSEARFEYNNLAAYIGDAQHIHIVQVGELSSTIPNVPVAVPIEPVLASQPTNSAGGSGTPQNGRININTASLEELQTIKGIGPTIAQRIIDYRATDGAFSTVEELAQVRGISATFVDNIQDSLTTGN